MKKIILTLIFFGFIFVAVLYFFFRGSFSGQKNIPAKKKLTVITSFYPLYFFASQITGDKADVYNITPAGAEPHDYEPTPQDMARMEKSDLVVLNGAGLEAWQDKIKENLAGTKTTVVIAGEKVATVSGDPHVWLSPSLAKEETKTILQSLVQIDPQNKNFYENNAKQFLNKLDQLDNNFKNGLKNCRLHDIITSHAAFGYLAKTYGLNQVTLTGLSPDEEPSAQRLAEISQFAKERQLRYIFFEKLLSPKLAETIASEIGAQTLVLDPLEGIGDQDQQSGKNYLTVMQENLTNLRQALACQ